jgi:L-asparaginase II
MTTAPLVETTRGLSAESATRECVHHGAIAVVDVAGRLLYGVGDPQTLCFTRSTLKPIQALPFIEDGGLRQFGFGSRELALLCASHSGADKHLEGVRKILAACGCGEDDLSCGVHAPLHFAAVGADPPAGARWTQLHNNCSGKHSGFLAWCRLHGHPTRGYLDWDHPLQTRIRGQVARVLGAPLESLVAGIDGCSAPNYAMPLAGIAHLYARLAQGSADPEFGEAFGAIFTAMTGHPELVSGEARGDLAYMRTAPGDWISKAGADGVQVLGSRSAGLGLAVKVADGSARALQVAVVEALGQLGLLQGRSGELLAAWKNPAIRNHRGLQTGAVRPIFNLRR